MHADFIFLPVILQVLLVILLYLVLGVRKKKASAAGNVDESRRSLHADAWPDDVIQVNNAIRNQFELPVLFYISCIILWAMQMVNLFTFLIALAFVASRYLHAVIHVGSNFVPNRRKVFALGVLLILLLNLLIASKLLMRFLY